MRQKSRPFRAPESHWDGAAVGHSPAGREMRCDCGNLLARVVAHGVELKCRRCKRTVLLPLDGEARTTSG